MGTASEPGPTGLRLAKNLREIRRRTSVRELSTRLRDLGRPLFPSAISKIENGQRRVDSDELVALAIALDCTPNRLLIGPTADDEEVTLVEGSTELPDGWVETEPLAREAWRWARGGEPLSTEPAVDGTEDDTELAKRAAHHAERRRRFQRENRPDDVPDHTDFTTLPVELRAALDAVAKAALPSVLAAHNQGLAWKTIARYLQSEMEAAIFTELQLAEASKPLSQKETVQDAEEKVAKRRARRQGADSEGGQQ